MMSDRKNAFTLTELLIVIGLLVLMLVLALPAVNFITGSRSTESATNVIGALLGTARAEAISRQSNVGVMFFWDRTKEQTVATLCAPADPWDATVSYVGGDVVQFGVNALTGNPNYYICLSPVAGGADPTNNSTFWHLCASYQPTMPLPLEGFDMQTLPKGVGLQGVVIGNDNLNNTLGYRAYDRYVSTACIMFDGEGRLLFTQYGIYAGENLTSNAPPPLGPINSRLRTLLQSNWNSTNMGQTQAAIALYDRNTFHDHANTNDSTPETDYLSGDFSTPPPGPQDSPTPSGPKSWSNQTFEQPEETWIDNNSTFLVVNRYNGTLLKSE